MRKIALRISVFVIVIGMGCAMGFFLASRMLTVQGQEKPGQGFAAIPGAVGGQDMFGAYDVVKGWPKDISTLPGNEKWTWGAGQSVYAENPNRVFMLFRGELPNIKRPATQAAARLRPRASQFPIGRLPWRDATVCGAARRGRHRVRIPTTDRSCGWNRATRNRRRREVGELPHRRRRQRQHHRDLDRSGTRSSSVRTSSPSIPTIRKSTSGSSTITCTPSTSSRTTARQLVQTIGTPTVKGADGTHFNRPTFLAWLPDSTMFVADGYNGTRVAKFDKNGKFLHGLGTERHAAERQASRLHEQRARHRRRSANAPRLRERSRQPSHSGVRRERQISLRVEHGRRTRPTSTCSISAPTARCGPSIAAPRRC